MENEIALAGLDIAKNVFQVHGADGEGRAVLRRRPKRDQVENRHSVAMLTFTPRSASI